ncbi:phosphodiester glycosidase family protein [Candidatus Woesebacteria bacterium]|nr:phosphodiester glycosidase family protein [Candidatus Woesebacteria bacterium]
MVHKFAGIKHHLPTIAVILGYVVILGVAGYLYTRLSASIKSNSTLSKDNSSLQTSLTREKKAHQTSEENYQALQKEDQYVINQELAKEVAAIKKIYKKSVEVYERLVSLREISKKTDAQDKQYAQSLKYLVDFNYASAEAQLITLDADIAKEKEKLASTFAIPANVTSSNKAPSSGYSRQRVSTPVGEYMIDIIAADLNSSRVIVDTASDGTCTNNCPVAALGTYASRSGGFAGINGPYFCPASYPSCAGKTNSFDTLLMNKNKTYFNSDNNVYSTVPAVIFSGNSARFVSQSQQWGRDTGVDSVIAGQPLLMLNGNRVFGGDGEPKRSGKGSRSFIGATGNTVYIGVVHNVSTAEMAYVLQTLGISSALNLDSGGSTALWNGGRYIVGPGRDTPFGIVITRK